MSSIQQKPFVPPFFTKYGQFSKDTLNKKFEYKHKLSTIASHRNGLRLESGAILQDGGSVVGYVKSRFPQTDYGTLTAELYSDAASESNATFVARGLPTGVALSATVSSRDKDKAFKGPVDSVEATYRAEYVAASVKGKSDLSTHKVDASLSVGTMGISVGGMVSVDASNGADVTEVNAGVEYEQDDYIASIYTEANQSRVTAAYFQRLTPSHVLAATFSQDVQTRSDRRLSVGNEYRIDTNTTVKSRVEIPTGDVSTHVEHRLSNPLMLLGISSSFNLKSQKIAADKVGVSFSFGEF